MPASVLSYNKIMQDEEEIDNIVVRFTGFNSNILVYEQYCVNPECSCTDAILTFIELTEEGKPVNKWFTIKLDFNTWQVTEQTVLNNMINADKMIEEFMENLEEYKKKLISHFISAKEYGKMNYLDYISDETVKMILEGRMLPYSKVFGRVENHHIYFEFKKDKQWFFDDQYCSNPDCSCRESMLTFYKTDVSKTMQEAEFAIKLNIDNLKYDIEFKKCDKNSIVEIIEYLKINKPEAFSILKSRYNEMKKASKEIIKKFGAHDNKKKQPKAKVRRNDPCLCGSGKKYKKCCLTKSN